MPDCEGDLGSRGLAQKGSFRLEALREADGAQLRGQVLPLPDALGFPIGLAAAVQAHGFHGVGRGVRRVVEHVGYRARLTGGTSSSDGGGCPYFCCVTRSRVSCKRSGTTCRHREFSALPGAQCGDCCARPIIARSLFLEY